MFLSEIYQNSKMKILPLLFGYIFSLYKSHEIARRNAGSISATNLCINECTGVADNWTDFSVSGIKVDGELFNFSNAKVFTS